MKTAKKPTKATKVYHRPLPAVLAACKAEYELQGASFRQLEGRYGIARSTLAYHANLQDWTKPGLVEPAYGAAAAREIETEILAKGLRRRRRGDTLPPNPSIGDRPHYRGSGDLIEGVLAVPDVSNTAALSVQTEAATCVASGVVKAISVTPSNHDENPAKIKSDAEVESPAIPPDRPAAPSSAKAQTSRKPRSKDIRTADIIDFPNAKAQPPRVVGTVQLLPEKSADEKSRLRVTLAAIRAMMSVEQVQLLEHHKALLARYSHLLEVYLDPAHFVREDGLDEYAYAEKVTEVQRTALMLLLPTDRDTLNGAIKTLTGALKDTLLLERAVVGMDKVKSGAFRPENGDPLGDDDGGAKLLDLGSMGTKTLRGVQLAMEALDRHQHLRTDAPKPPPPEPIDDLMDPDPEPPEIPR